MKQKTLWPFLHLLLAQVSSRGKAHLALQSRTSAYLGQVVLLVE